MASFPYVLLLYEIAKKNSYFVVVSAFLMIKRQGADF